MVNVEELAQQIQKYDEAYRAGNPLISDALFDELRATLVNLDPKTSNITFSRWRFRTIKFRKLFFCFLV